jgi:hypothetical protein
LNEKSEDEGFTIELLQIEILGENCLFDKVRNPGKSGKVKARVKDADEVINCKSRYSIFFRITNSDGESLYFNLDPFLRGKS